MAWLLVYASLFRKAGGNMMGVRDYPKDREEESAQDGGVETNWLGRCLEDRFEIGAVIAQTDLVAIHEANTVDGGAPLLATIYKGLELDDAALEVLHNDLGCLLYTSPSPRD